MRRREPPIPHARPSKGIRLRTSLLLTKKALKRGSSRARKEARKRSGEAAAYPDRRFSKSRARQLPNPALMADDPCMERGRDGAGLPATADGLRHCESMGYSVPDHCRADCQEERSSTKKQTTTATMRVNAIMLMLLLTMTIMSGQSEENRQTEQEGEKLRNFIGGIENTQPEHLAAMSERVEHCETQPSKPPIYGGLTEDEKASKEFSEAGKTYRGRQDDCREGNGKAAREKLVRIALNPRLRRTPGSPFIIADHSGRKTARRLREMLQESCFLLKSRSSLRRPRPVKFASPTPGTSRRTPEDAFSSVEIASSVGCRTRASEV